MTWTNFGRIEYAPFILSRALNKWELPFGLNLHNALTYYIVIVHLNPDIYLSPWIKRVICDNLQM